MAKHKVTSRKKTISGGGSWSARWVRRGDTIHVIGKVPEGQEIIFKGDLTDVRWVIINNERKPLNVKRGNVNHDSKSVGLMQGDLDSAPSSPKQEDQKIARDQLKSVERDLSRALTDREKELLGFEI